MSDPSTFSGDTVDLQAGHDLTVSGSNVVSTHGTTLAAKNDIAIEAATQTGDETHAYQKSKSGVFASGNSLTLGSQKLKTSNDTQTVTNLASTVGSVNGDVTITAGKDALVRGSDLIAGRDINVTGSNVTMDAVNDTTANQQSMQFKQNGLSVSLNAPVIQSAQAATAAANRAGDVKDERLQALYAYRAAKNAVDAVGQASDIAKSGDPASALKLSVTVGSSKASSQSSQNSTTAHGDTLTAGRDINLTATGDTGPDRPNGDITARGTTANAGRDITLAATRDINLESAANTSNSQSSNKSSSASVGVAISTTGPALIANASAAKGNSNGQDLTHTETTLNAADTLTLESGRDTNLKGAIVQGNTVIADIGRNLNLQSEQDSSTYQARQQSAAAGISVGLNGNVGGNISGGKSNTDSNYQSVIEQTAINAGSGGFDIHVNDNTDLKGAIINSTATPDNNRLVTGTLTTSDIQNHGQYQADSMNLGVNVGGNLSTGTGKPAGGTKGNSGLDAGLGGLAVADSGSASGTTKSAITNGDITITDAAAQQRQTGKTAAQTVATLNRDTANANGSIQNPFNQQKVAEQLEFLQVAGEEIVKPVAAQAAKWIGDTFPPDPNNPDRIDPAKVAAHAALGAAMTTLLGTGWQSGALGGAMGDVLPNALAKAFETDPQTGKPKNEEAFKAANAILAAALASATGSDLAQTINAGMTAKNAVENNYLNHTQLAQKRVELAKAKTLEEKAAIEKKYDKLDAKQQRDAEACVLHGEGCAIGESTLKTAYQELMRDCASNSPYICDAGTKESLKQLNLLYADKDTQDTNLILAVLGGSSTIAKSAMGWVTKEVSSLLGMSDTIKAVRAELPRDLASKGNMATSQIDIPGLPPSLTASSRVDEASYGLVGEGKQNFTWSELQNAAGISIPRNADSEYKILDNIADQLGSNTAATGSVKILTERPACDSCLDVANQFRSKYPNIEVTIYNNNGVVLGPKTYVTPMFDPNLVGVKK